MYADWFDLSENPFSLTPDPRYLFLSERHREALAHLLYGAGHAGGFVQLTGEVGTGKTMMCRAFLAQLPEEVEVALVLNPKLSAAELLCGLCEELRIPVAADASVKGLIDALNRYLLDAHAQGRRVVAIIDEAQNLLPEVLEQVRLLTNLETEQQKLLQIFLIGQPELRELLRAPGLRQVDQRITARYHLAPLSEAETVQYIEHRLAVAGARRPLFSRAALRHIARRTGGIPRLVNILCDRALLGAYATDRKRVDGEVVRRAAAELEGESGRGRTRLPRVAALLLALGGMVALAPWGEPLVAAAFSSRAALAEAPGRLTEAPAVSQPPGQLPAYVLLEQALAEQADADAAQRGLLQQWSVSPPVVGQELCETAELLGLKCYQTSGGWEQLRQLDRPVLVTLSLPDGRVGEVLVTALDQQALTVEVNGERRVIPLSELDRSWYGQFRLLWKPAQRDFSLIGPGASALAVRWLGTTLDRVEGISPQAAPAARYDQALADRLKAFQQRSGLVADGVAGPQTLIHLNNALGDPAIPRLSRPRG